MRLRWVIAGCAALALAAGGATYYRSLRARPASRAEAAAAAVPNEITLAARLQPVSTVEIGVPVQGTLHAFHAEVGADVYEGQLLAEIRNEAAEDERRTSEADVEQYQARVQNLEASLAAARLEASRAAADASRARSEFERAERLYQRQKLLIGEGATPRKVFEKSEEDYRAAETGAKGLTELAQQSEERAGSLQKELDNARKLLEAKTGDLEAAQARTGAGAVTSPVTGVVTARRGQINEQVDPSIKDLFRIATDVSTLQAAAEASAADLQYIRPEQPAFITIAEMGDALQGVVKAVEQERVIVEFPNPNPAIKPGLAVTIRIPVQARPAVR